MSADNGIYILKTNRFLNHEYEYRVREMGAVENVYWCEEDGKETKDQDVWIYNARKMWGKCKVFTSRKLAYDEAIRLYDNIMDSDFPVLEYGISEIKIGRVF